MNSIATIAQMVREAEEHADSMSKDRIQAEEYYRGEMTDVPARPGHSSMVKKLLRAQIKKVLPSLVRTILGSDQVVEYVPVGPNDEEGAQQATDYVNIVSLVESDIRRTIENGIHDALKVRNGILKWWWDDRTQVKVSRHTGLDEMAFAMLASEDGVEVLEHTERQEAIDAPGPDGAMVQQPVTVHDLKIRRNVKVGVLRTSAVARENFLIHPDAITLQESSIVGEKTRQTRSDLVAMGYDRELVYGLPVTGDDDTEDMARRDEVTSADESHKPNEQIDYYDLYVRFDSDDDGIAELRHMVFAGGLTEKNLLLDEECDDIQICDVKVMAQSHQWEGISLSDDLMDLQRAETVLLRETLDNIYWQNKPQPVMQDGVITNPEAVFNPEFGLPIKVQRGTDVRAAMGYDPKTFVAGTSFQMLEYLDSEATERAGVSDASSGMAPDALQNMTAKASAMIEQSGIGQTELMARTLAEGLRVFFRGILRLTIRHQDKGRTVRMRGEWVDVDPRHWNADMDCAVNTGLGAGTRERDLIVMQQVLGIQEKLLAAYGPDNPFVKPDQLYNTVAKLVEAAGLKTPSLYFTEPNPEEIKAKMAAAAQQPTPEQAKAQAQMQIEQAKLQAQGQLRQLELQADMQMEDKRMQAQANKELAQMQADMKVKELQVQSDMQIEAANRETQVMLADKQIAWEREKLTRTMQAEIQKAQAAAIGNALTPRPAA